MELSTSFSEEIRDSSDIQGSKISFLLLKNEPAASRTFLKRCRVIGADCISHGPLKGRHIVESTFAQRCNDYCRDVSNGVFYGCFLLLIGNFR